MTREEFFKNIKNVKEEDILPAFDSLMAFFNLYNVIGIYENIEITKTDKELANFDIKFQDKVDIDEYCNLSGLNILIYGIKWKVICEKKDTDSLHISLII